MTHRPLFVNFNLHTDGDVEFKKELIGMMIANILELQESLRHSLQLADFTPYRNACHKINSTISMLNDQEFTDTIDEIKKDGKEGNINFFNRLCAEVIDSLEADKNS